MLQPEALHVVHALTQGAPQTVIIEQIDNYSLLINIDE